ncbi:MAG: hypothetical protein PHR13_06970 [Dysgonamonadaceae bacterium]|nr:hypothetical protein [Dysgonamonadaceae bacterium]MDD3901046.1 hypothetical protein [Dysgonamonadaceae bacterium]
MNQHPTYFVNKKRFFLLFVVFLAIVFLTIFVVRTESINWTIATIEGIIFACFFQLFIQWKYEITDENRLIAKNILGIKLNNIDIKDISMMQVAGEREVQLYHSRGMLTPNVASNADMNSLMEEIKDRNPNVKTFIQDIQE